VNKGIYEAAIYHEDGSDKDHFDGKGFKARAARFSEGRLCRSIAHLDFDLARQDQLLIPHSDVIWTIYRNTDDFLLQTPTFKKVVGVQANAQATYLANANTYRLKLHDLRLYVKQVDLNPSLNNAIARHLEQSPAKYAQRRVELRNVFLGEGRQDVAHPVFTSNCPRRLIVCFVASGAFNGDRTKSPFKFEHAKIRSISAEFGGFTFPNVPYDLNFADGNYVRAYVDMYLGMGMADSWPTHDQRTLSIGMREFATHSCFFVIPMTSTLEDTAGMELIRSGTTLIKCLFNEPIAAGGMEMLVLGEFDSILSINADRVLSTDGSV
jgi:hypothetical protein